jgi:uncharacterized OB-fold protein
MMSKPAPAAAPAPPLSAPFFDALKQGQLSFQRCRHCAHAWLPARGECPRCLSAEPAWERASGRAKLVSWVVYHASFNPDSAKALPYTVAFVELEEGPRLLSNIVECADPEALRIEQPLFLRIEDESGTAVPRFSPLPDRA